MRWIVQIDLLVVNDFENITSINNNWDVVILFDKMPCCSKKESVYSIIRIKGNKKEVEGRSPEAVFYCLKRQSEGGCL